MENQLFRQKSIDRISSPEELHDYMRVTGPRLWMILAAIVVLLAGFIVYASTVTMENSIPIRVEVSSYETGMDGAEGQRSYLLYSELPDSYVDTVKKGMNVRIMNETGHVSMIMSMEKADTVGIFIQMDNEQVPLKDGNYDAVLVLESTTPLSFLWN